MEFKKSAIIAACDALATPVEPSDMETAVRVFASEGGYSIVETPRHPMSLALEDLHDLKSILDAETNRLLQKEDSDWKSFHDRAFGDEAQNYKRRAKDTLSSIGWSHPSYYDPDTGYRDDALAWVRAFEEVLSELEAVNDHRLSLER
ncbi:hypothetical protein O9X98_14265 [Agrobacterium salinitolerans]|nr:hypothetical protein [Agrobacterium salinitolerans]